MDWSPNNAEKRRRRGERIMQARYADYDNLMREMEKDDCMQEIRERCQKMFDRYREKNGRPMTLDQFTTGCKLMMAQNTRCRALVDEFVTNIPTQSHFFQQQSQMAEPETQDMNESFSASESDDSDDETELPSIMDLSFEDDKTDEEEVQVPVVPVPPVPVPPNEVHDYDYSYYEWNDEDMMTPPRGDLTQLEARVGGAECMQ